MNTQQQMINESDGNWETIRKPDVGMYIDCCKVSWRTADAPTMTWLQREKILGTSRKQDSQ
jgi:hypothetical protein